jgi:hypothetical protein
MRTVAILAIASAGFVACAISGPAQSTPQRRAAQCVVPVLPVTPDPVTFNDRGNPSTGRGFTLTPRRSVALIADFRQQFAQSFRSLCAKRKIPANLFARYRHMQIVNSSGDTDGHFFESEENKRTVIFEVWYADDVRMPKNAMQNALTCFARPTTECMAD